MRIQKQLPAVLAVGFAFGVAMPLTSSAAEPLKVGLVSFFSGPVSGPVGIPSRNGADLIIEAINAGKLPAPYSGIGIGGRLIEPTYVDEAVEPVSEYRNLVQRQGVDAVIGYASSGSCLGVAPIAEELKTLTLLYYCGSVRTFEEGPKKYVFRTMNSQDVENIAAARYVLSTNKDVKAVSGINQNYGWGQESWRDFTKTLQQLKPDIQVETALFPKIFAGQYGAEITALSRNPTDIIHSSFWGGDLDAFILQAAPRSLLKKQTAVLTTGGTAMRSLSKQIPDGTIIGVRGNGGVLAPESDFNNWFRDAYEKKYGEQPSFPAYYMGQAVLALKAAGDKAYAATQKAPSVDEIREALVGLTYETPAGPIAMARHNGHQAATDIAYGTFKLEDGKPTLINVKRYTPECVIAPEGTKSLDWIEAGFPGAKCD
ncbi:ABC transporter substrate-binding protein [Castellaniella sp. S9]|uniref:ABC transporter substrate-binding protein n=1 Tax=Castellaniella sp. S9 TaxID=2993652 RepID=UPI0022B522B5|nr:ABC transporter substrate-binding protein [Castellaniella sp. S9]